MMVHLKLEFQQDFFDIKSVVYYVGRNDKVEKINVTKEDGFAVFNTNHFIIYTLIEEDEEANLQHGMEC